MADILVKEYHFCVSVLSHSLSTQAYSTYCVELMHGQTAFHNKLINSLYQTFYYNFFLHRNQFRHPSQDSRIRWALNQIFIRKASCSSGYPPSACHVY